VLIRPFAGEDGEFKAPGLEEFVGLPGLFFEGTPFEINRIIMVRLIALAIMVLLIYIALRKSRHVPSRGQGTAELALDFVRVQIADQVLGERLGRKYLPLLASLFFAILAMNITGIVPFANIAGTSLIGMPLTMAIVSYVAFVYAGIREVGGWPFLRNALFPSGVPWPLYFLLAPVELINIFIMRPISLALRLLLNMMVGHLLLVLAFSATNFFFVYVEWPTAAFGALTLFGGIVITLFELLVSVLQAYVFTLLTAVYIQQAASDHH
jgi:F-type H+-transporting ATPase subunit a